MSRRRQLVPGLPDGVTCVECAVLGWASCGTARDLYCVASDRVSSNSEPVPLSAQEGLW